MTAPLNSIPDAFEAQTVGDFVREALGVTTLDFVDQTYIDLCDTAEEFFLETGVEAEQANDLAHKFAGRY